MKNIPLRVLGSVALWSALALGFIVIEARHVQAAGPVVYQAYTAAWLAVTQDVNGGTLAGPVTYQLHVGPPGKEQGYGAPVSILSETIYPSAAGVLCATVTALAGGLESAPPGEVCVTVPNPPPPVAAVPKTPAGLTLH